MSPAGTQTDPRLRDLIRDDLSRGDFFDTMRSDYHDLKELFFNDDRKARLNTMRPLKRRLVTAWWLIRMLILKLTPARRLLLLLAFILMFSVGGDQIDNGQVRISYNFGFVSASILLFIIMLELKDKLLAKTELQEGRAIQKQMMPEESPAVEGWSLWLFTRPANDVGGDLVDFQRLDGNRCGLTLADVAGKGLNAALLSVKLQATVRALAPGQGSIASLVSSITRLCRGDGIRKMFASIVQLELTAGSGTIRYVNAGHFPPLALQGGTLRELEKGDPAIGLMEQVEFREQTVTLNPGEALILYSDGLPEAKNEFGSFYGQERLRNLLPALASHDAPAMGERLLRDIASFVGKARIYDDLSVIILKRAGV